MTMNTKCKWKGFQKVGESQPRGVIGIDYRVGTVYANHAEKMTKFNYMYIFQIESMHFQIAS
jgi:hypothetical protein